MKGATRLKVLEFLESSAQLVDDVVFIFTLPYGTSYSRMQYLLEKRRAPAGRKQKFDKHICRQFNDFLYRLRKDGLITEARRDEKSFLALTPRGNDALQKLRSSILPARKYENKQENLLKIIIFDIPEKEKRKREWLRNALKNMDFSMLQKSVWAGKAKLPKEFIKDLDKINILPYIEIFEISRTGSLQQLKINR